MAARRALVVLIVLLTATGLGMLLLRVLAPGGWTLPKLVMLAAFLGTAPWTGALPRQRADRFLCSDLLPRSGAGVFPPPRNPPRIAGAGLR